MQTSTLTEDGQITIPASIRHLLALEPGDRINFVVEDGQVKLVKSEQRIEALFGLVKAEHSVSLNDMERALHDHAAKRAKR